MEEEKKKKILNVMEWSVENFTSWNIEIHGKVIESPEFQRSYVDKFELYPRGLSGCGDHLVIRVLNYSLCVLSFDLFFLGPDGSVLCSMQIKTEPDTGEERYRDLDLPPGPEFQDVVTKIRQEEAVHGDRLTLRCRREENLHVERRAVTTIQTIDATLQISKPAFSSLFRGDRRSWISGISNPLATMMGNMNVWVIRDETDESKLGLEVDPLTYGKVPLVWTRVTVMSHDRTVRTQEVEHLVVSDKMKWTVLDSLSVDEVKKGGFSLLLRLKIIPVIEYRHSHISALEFTKYVSDGMATVASGCRFSRIYGEGEKPETTGAVLSKELSGLYKNRDFSDFELKCGDVSFPVHRVILSARSPVFKTMLLSDMIEAASGCMDIVDLDPSTLDLFLVFLYTGDLENLKGENALKLYYAADKYLVPSLQKECANVLCGNISISNVCGILSLADRHRDTYLATGAHEFVLENYNKVLKSDEWVSFSRSEPLLAEETLSHLDKKFKPRKTHTLWKPLRKIGFSWKRRFRI